MNPPANNSRAMRTIQTINTAPNRKCLGGKDKKREKSLKAAIAQDKENIQHMGAKDKKMISETKKPKDEACDLIVNETLPSIYWEELAESRRLVLVEAAKENEELHGIFDFLKTECVQLRQTAHRAELLEEMLKELFEETSSDEAEAED